MASKYIAGLIVYGLILLIGVLMLLVGSLSDSLINRTPEEVYIIGGLITIVGGIAFVISLFRAVNYRG